MERRDTISRAIENRDIFTLNLYQLEEKYGKEAFNSDILYRDYDMLSLTRIDRNVKLPPMLVNGALKYNCKYLSEYFKELLIILYLNPETTFIPFVGQKFPPSFLKSAEVYECNE